MSLVETDWLENNLNDPNIRIFDCTVWLNPHPKKIYTIVSGKKDYNEGHIPNSDFLDLNDMEGMNNEAEKSKNLGFSGKGSIHPKQISSLNNVFTPNKQEISRARQIISTYEAADTGLVVIDGKLIEKPVMREMYRIIAIADRIKR